MLDGKETELEIIDHPSAEMSIETFCSTYNPDVCVVVYSVDDRGSMKVAEEMLMYLWKSDYMSSRGVILVGNKADLERKREIPTSGRRIQLLSGLARFESDLAVPVFPPSAVGRIPGTRYVKPNLWVYWQRHKPFEQEE
ncbi:UNVERIFIED_CONTAM: hypothetical protein PYX00_000813 [Menopon gallinae]|uniref:Uncharacterized protein n=1 Tax=Menopon gallinae TaxID=328185 RepID=A0AAW2IBP4_9NEOP